MIVTITLSIRMADGRWEKRNIKVCGEKVWAAAAEFAIERTAGSIGPTDAEILLAAQELYERTRVGGFASPGDKYVERIEGHIMPGRVVNIEATRSLLEQVADLRAMPAIFAKTRR